MQAIRLENKIDGVGLKFNLPGAYALDVLEGGERVRWRINRQRIDLKDSSNREFLVFRVEYDR
jgi:hypothetical protein